MHRAGCVMPGDFEAKVTGLPDLRAALLSIAPKLRKRALRNALAAGARVIRTAAVAEARKHNLAAPIRNRAGQVIRKPGTVADAIAVRTSKVAAQAGDVGVFVNVRPAKGARYKTVTTKALGGAVKLRQRVKVRASQRGAANPNDPFYWRFLEFGTAKTRPAGFLQKAARLTSTALQVFIAKIGPQIQRLNGGKGVEL